MKGKKTNQEIHESKRREEEACLEEKQNIEETASGQDVTESGQNTTGFYYWIKKETHRHLVNFTKKPGDRFMGMPTACCSRPRSGGGGPGNISEDMERGSVL